MNPNPNLPSVALRVVRRNQTPIACLNMIHISFTPYLEHNVYAGGDLQEDHNENLC